MPPPVRRAGLSAGFPCRLSLSLSVGCLLVFLSAVKPLDSAACLSLSLSFLLSCVCVLALRVSRPTLILICSDQVQFGPPVDLCVRELSPPLSIVTRRLWRAW